MSDSYEVKVSRPANSADFEAIAICFEEETINLLFSELLNVRGVKTEILESIDDFSGKMKLITEPQFLDSIPHKHHHRCLVVGNKDRLVGLESITLSRPLTEEKIEQALRNLLRG